MSKDEKILELLKKYNPEGYKLLTSGDKVVVEEHLAWLCEKYTLEQIEEDLKNGNDDYITLDFEEDKRALFKAPEWIKEIKDKDIYSAVYALLFSWAWDGKPQKIDDIQEYVAESFDDMSESQIAEICDILIKHNVLKPTE